MPPVGIRAEWEALQAAYRETEAAASDYRITCRVRLGAETGYWPRANRKRLDVLDRARERVFARIMAWLAKYSPWDWMSGTSSHWICSSLSYDQATAAEAPVLPADSASYGNPHREHRPESRG